MKTLPVILALQACCSYASAKPKNIVIIQSDDVGFYDYSYRGSTEIPTPNIDALAYNGLIMNRFYTAPLCTPSRGSLMTGKYPHHIGLQHNVAWNDEPWGLGLEHKLLPEYFKEAGYKTHLIGKWHLGFHKQSYLPTNRGFDTHFGFYGPWTDYFSHTFYMADRNYSRGLDLRDQLEVADTYSGEYATDLYTRKAIEVIENHANSNTKEPLLLILNQMSCHMGNDDAPLQAKPEDIARFPHITDPKRKLYAAMLHALDESIGKVVEALVRTGLMKKTLLAYYTDNGGATAIPITKPNSANNFPLKSQKGLAWEGGIHVNLVIYAPFIPRSQIRNQLFHVSDILPTFGSLADAELNLPGDLDGIDLSNMILEQEEPFREEIVVTDPVYGISGVILQNYKLLSGTFIPLRGLTDNWFGFNPTNNPLAFDDYVELVLNSTVAVSLLKFNKSVKSKTIGRLRESSRVKCLGTEYRNACNLLSAPCLFDIDNDPCEENNLASIYPEKVDELLQKLSEEISEAYPLPYRPPDARCDPANFGGIWTWWAQDIPEYI